MLSKGFLLLAALIFAITSYGQSVDTAWTHQFNNPDNTTDEPNAICLDADGNVYVTGYSWRLATNRDWATIKYTATGDTAWVRYVNGAANGHDRAYDVGVDPSGNVYVCGEYRPSGSYSDFKIVCYDAGGTVSWEDQFNGSGNYNDVGLNLAIDNDGNIIVSGSINTATTSDDIFLVKYRPNGDTAWMRTYDGTGHGLEDANAMVVDASGNIYITGRSEGATSPDYITVKYDSTGTLIWDSRYASTGTVSEWAYAIDVDASGYCYVTGFTTAESKTTAKLPTHMNYLTIKYDTNGDTVWTRQYDGPISARDEGWAIAADDLGNVYVTGNSEGDGTSYDILTIKYDADGNEVWVERYQNPGYSSGQDEATEIAIDTFGFIYVAGKSITDCITMKYNQSGDTIWTDLFDGGSGNDWVADIALDADANVYFTGMLAPGDYGTVKYIQTIDYPVVTAVSPDLNTLAVDPTDDITITFDMDMDPLTLTSASIRVCGHLGGDYDGSISYDGPSRMVTFDPDDDFRPGEVVTVMVSPDALSDGGNPLEDGYSWQFTTAVAISAAYWKAESFCAAGVGSGHNDVTYADFDIDGLVDLASAQNTVCIFLNDGNRDFILDGTYGSGINFYNLTSADFNRDGAMDLAASTNTGYIAILLNNGDGSFQTPVSYPTGASPRQLIAEDFNGDLDIDIAVIDITNDEIYLHLNDGTGVFSAGDTITDLPYASTLAVADFNSDGHPDICTDRYDDVSETWFLRVLANDGDAGFADYVDYEINSNSVLLEITPADLDADGDADLAYTFGKYVAVLFNDGNGAFSGETSYLLDENFFVQDDLLAHDFDGDGDIDLATTNSFGYLTVLSNQGNGTYISLFKHALGSVYRNIAAADIDNDGDLDITAARHDEDRMTTYTNRDCVVVKNFSDTGENSFGWAIDSANIHPGADTIVFDAQGTISITTSLPPITDDSTVISGRLSKHGDRSVTLMGDARAGGNGLDIQSSHNTVQGMIIMNFSENGIVVSGASSVGNTITKNYIYSNGLLGIDLNDDGVTLNDIDDSDTGPNNLLNYPVVDSIRHIGSYDYFAVFGHAEKNAVIESYVAHPANDTINLEDPSGHGEAYFMASSSVATCDAEGRFMMTINEAYADEFSLITLTATDTLGNTSEFSHNFRLTPSPLVIVAYSPVNFNIIDPAGDSIGKDPFGTLSQSIVDATYDEDPDDSVTIFNPLDGEYLIVVIPEHDAPLGETYSVGVRLDGSMQVIIVEDADVPADGTADSLVYLVEEGYHYMNGDSNGDDAINLLDILMLIDCIYAEGECPQPEGSGDANCDLALNLLDILYLIDYLYGSPLGPAPCEL